MCKGYDEALGENTTPEREFAAELTRILEKAKERNIVLRVVGALAFQLHCPEFATYRKTSKRKLSDIDFVAYGSQIDDVMNLFRDLGYSYDEHQYLHATSRIFLHNRINDIGVDIFFDSLEMCHKIELKSRLEVDYPTISLADLLLTKMQIVKITEKDVLDTIALLKEHRVGESDEETINCSYISNILSTDWGFYYTVVTNLGKVRDDFLPKYASSDEDRALLKTKIDTILLRIEEEPKSLRWRMRAKIGTKKKWYEDVEEMPDFI